MNEEPLIQLRNLTKVYGRGDAAFQALKGVNLDINAGEFVAVMGPSGSGKSTLMNVMGRLDVHSPGSYQFQGIQVVSLCREQWSVLWRHAPGFIFQGFNLLARTLALENVELPLLYRGYSRRRRQELACAALASVGLPDKLRNTPAELSGGQQQRVPIARAIVTSPGTLFADEPTGNLDSKTTREITGLLQRLNVERGITILMVTCEDEVASCARRVIRVKDGIIERDTVNLNL
jgi:putative ABC transport system ATP-binding protein